MMILVILSHGRDGKIITSSGREYQIESIYEKFNNRECPSLKGKPKFFIIQVCSIHTEATRYIRINIIIVNLNLKLNHCYQRDFDIFRRHAEGMRRTEC